MTRSALVAAAGDYLTRGLAVIALTGKTPNVALHKRGLYDALRGAPEDERDWGLIESIFDHPKTTGIGILTGEPYIVVDIDGEEGAEQWKRIAGADFMPDRWVAATHHGLHMWFAPPLDQLAAIGESLVGPGTIKLGSKLDMKGYGGYVAAPPSAFDDAEDCEREHMPNPTYEWLLPPGDDAPFEVPQGLAREIEEHVADLRMSIAAKETRRRAWGPRWKEGDHVYYAQPGHDALLKGMTEAQEGNRNAYLHWAAATLEEEGASDELFEALYEAAIANGLTREESKRTIRSARRLRG